MQLDPKLAQGFALANAGRVAEGVALIASVAAGGDAEGLFAMADIHWRGDVAGYPRSGAFAFFEAAAAKGHPIAAVTLTNLLANGGAGPRDWQRGLARLREEARALPHRAQALALIEAMDLTEDGDPATLPAPDVLSEAPEIARWPGLFTIAECDYLIRAAEPRLQPSFVADGRGGEMRDPIRSSDGASLQALVEDPAIHALNRRLAAVSGSTVEQAEPLQVLRYAPGQQYRRHLDWQPDGGNARILTALAYLNDGYTGGETEFAKIGVTVAGKRGDGLVFRNGTASAADPLTEHAGMPVASGVKFLASRWIRERAYQG